MAVQVKADALCIKDLGRSATWVSDLKSTISRMKHPDQKIYLVVPIVPAEGIYNFTQDLRAIPEFSAVRCVKILYCKF